MLGKNAARAAPMLALAARSACSAARTSGRRTSSSAGSPAGNSLREGLRIDGLRTAADFGRQRLAHQQRQRIAIRGHAPRLLRDVDLGLAPGGLRAMQLDFARHAVVEAQLGEVVGLLLAVARFVGQPQQFAVRDQREPGGRDLRHQQQLRRGAVLFEREVILQRGVAQAAHATEQVQLEGRHGQAGACRCA